MRKNQNLLAMCLAFSVANIAASPAWADAGVPMLVIVWPWSWLLLLAIVPIEAVVACRILGVGKLKALQIATVANLVSSIVGIPVTWLLMFGLEFVLTQTRALGMNSDLNRFLSVTAQSPWLVPYEQELYWMVPAAAAFLCIPFFFMSVLVEYLCARGFLPKDRRPDVWRWSWIANGITYGLIVAGLLAYLIYELQTHHHGISR